MRRLSPVLVSLLALAAPATATAAQDLARYVDPMVGTLPPGFTVPGSATPFGMVQNSPDTISPIAYSGYSGMDNVIRGFSLVHLSGPGVKKGGDFPFMPTLGPTDQADPASFQSPFDKASEKAEAGYYSVRLATSQTQVELTSSTHAAMQRYTFPPAPRASVVVDVTRSAEGTHAGGWKVTGPDEITGWARGRYPVFFVAKFSRPFTSHDARSVSFETVAGARTITMRAGVSFVDEAGARRNLAAEAPSFDFDAMRADARAAWNRQLAKVKVTGGLTTDRTSLYTALYHAMLHPNTFTDVDGRYRGMDDQIHVAEGRIQYANFSSWDTYKGSNQLLALLEPKRYREMLLSLLADKEHLGKLPRWGEQSIDASHMSGDPAIPMIADGACRGLLSRGELHSLYDASADLATKRSPDPNVLGYLPGRPGTTLEYGIADFALALLADASGDDAAAARYLKQSLNYRNLLEKSTGWVRPRNADGTYSEPFSPTDETGFQEGNSWQYSWLATHDIAGVFERMGGLGVARDRLDHLFRQPSELQNRLTVYGLVYRFDQYAPGNEHDLQLPYLFPYAGQPWKTQGELRELQTLFRPTQDGLPGNDDLGGLSGWYAFTALGFGPVTPGAPFHIVGSPQFEQVVLKPDGGRAITIDAPNAGPLNAYVQRASLNGKALTKAWFRESALTKRGGTLRLEMGPQPNTTWATAPGDVPPSVADGLKAFGCQA